MRELQNEVRSGGSDEASGERAIHRPPPDSAFRSSEPNWDDLLDDTPTHVGPAGFAHAAFAATDRPPLVIRPAQPHAGETLRLPPEENPLAAPFSLPEAVWPLKEQARTLRLGALRAPQEPVLPSSPVVPLVASVARPAAGAPRRGIVTLVIGLLVLCAMALFLAAVRFGAVAFVR